MWRDDIAPYVFFAQCTCNICITHMRTFGTKVRPYPNIILMVVSSTNTGLSINVFPLALTVPERCLGTNDDFISCLYPSEVIDVVNVVFQRD